MLLLPEDFALVLDSSNRTHGTGRRPQIRNLEAFATPRLQELIADFHTPSQKFASV